MAKNAAIILKVDDYEALYIKHQGYDYYGMAEQGHTINEGTERVKYFLDASKNYEFDIWEIEFREVQDPNFISDVHSLGSFPMQIEKIPA